MSQLARRRYSLPDGLSSHLQASRQPVVVRQFRRETMNRSFINKAMFQAFLRDLVGASYSYSNRANETVFDSRVRREDVEREQGVLLRRCTPSALLAAIVAVAIIDILIWSQV